MKRDTAELRCSNFTSIGTLCGVIPHATPPHPKKRTIRIFQHFRQVLTNLSRNRYVTFRLHKVCRSTFNYLMGRLKTREWRYRHLKFFQHGGERSNSWSQYAYSAISRKRLEIETLFQSTTNRKWHMGHQMVTWPMTSRDPQRCLTVGYSDSLASCLTWRVLVISYIWWCAVRTALFLKLPSKPTQVP